MHTHPYAQIATTNTYKTANPSSPYQRALYYFRAGSRNVPAKTFLPKSSHRNVPANKVPVKKAPDTKRFPKKVLLLKGSHKKHSWDNKAPMEKTLLNEKHS
jgi:hypothetical protein